MIGYYFITDRKLSRQGNISDIKSALRAKVKFIQYREKDLDTRAMYAEALALRELCRKVFFLINDRLDIALSVGADGLHLGQRDLPLGLARRLLGRKKIIGVTVHNLKEAQDMQSGGADYLSVAPMFATKTKPDAAVPVGIDLIRMIKKHVSVPIVAIGGITLFNAGEVIQAGADGLCAISAVVTKRDVRRQIEKFQLIFREIRGR